MLASFGILTVVPWILFAQSHWDMDTVPGFLAGRRVFESRPEIQDRARVFSPDAVHRTLEAFRQHQKNHTIPIRIETIRSLNGVWIADVAHQKARLGRAHHLYILLAQEEREVGVIAARSGPASRLTDQERERIRLAFLGPAEAGEFDRSLEQGIQTIGTALNASTPAQAIFPTQDGVVSFVIIVGLLFLFAYQSRDGSRFRWSRFRAGPKGESAPVSPTFGPRNNASGHQRPIALKTGRRA